MGFALRSLSCNGGVLFVALWALPVGCASSQGSTKKLSYGQTARANYQKGLAELEDENYPEAERFFNFVKTKFPFSRYSTLAELRIADGLFKQEKYAAAADAYRLFINFHPTHPRVIDGYAAFRVCAAQTKQIPDDWFLIPPSFEKDQTSTKQALSDLSGFMRTHPRSKYLTGAKQLYRDCLRRLVAHELYVARFYLDRDKPQATIMRLEGVLQRYPDAGVDPEVMLLLGQTYLKMNKRSEAVRTFAALVERYPQDVNSSKAKLYLQHLKQQ